MMVIYSPNNIYRQGFLAILKKMVSNIIHSRELIWQLFLRDLKAKYKQSLLGWLWVLLMPTMTIATFLILNVAGVIMIRIEEIAVPYLIFGLLGISFWQLFANGWATLTGSVAAAGSLVSQINFPREALIISALGQVMVDFLIRLVLVVIIYGFYGLSPSIWFLLLPLYLLPLLLLTLGFGFITSLLSVIIRDTGHFISIGMNFFLFLMPIMYTVPEKSLSVIFNQYNPLFLLINTPREIIISGTIKYPLEFFLSSIIALIVFLIGWFVFYISQPKLTERI